jgi:hypothetical protein
MLLNLVTDIFVLFLGAKHHLREHHCTSLRSRLAAASDLGEHAPILVPWPHCWLYGMQARRPTLAKVWVSSH